MPDDAVTSLDVQFGALQFGTDASPFDFTTGDNSNSYQELGQRFLKLKFLVFLYYIKFSFLIVSTICIYIFIFNVTILEK